MLVAEDGSVDAVIIGVGGFLGIGEKNVAVSFEQIEQTTDDDGNMKLVLNATKERTRSAAPAFVTPGAARAGEGCQVSRLRATSPPPPAPEPAPAN